MMREAVSLMGGYGITEDCPGFLGNKWMDAQLEATYEGPEAVQRRQLSITMTNPLFLAQFKVWIAEMRGIASERPGTGACALATAMGMWLWTLGRLQGSTDADGGRLYQSARQGVTFPLADALCWLLAARCQILDVLELERRGASDPAVAEGLAGLVNFMTDLCHVQSARASGEVARICAELVFGYNRHPAWDEAGYRGCYQQDELDSLEGIIPGIGSYGLDVIGSDGSHPKKAGPCAKCNGAEQFLSLQTKLSTCLTGCRLSKDRAAEAISKLMIPEALDYPARTTKDRAAADGHRHRLRGLRPRDGRIPDDVEPQLAECGWVGAAAEYNISRLAFAGNLLRARRRARVRSLGRRHAGPWDTRQFSRRGSDRDSHGGGREDGESRIPARSRAGEPTNESPTSRIQGGRPRAALTWLRVRTEAVRAEA
jgi:hypothetical protein